jgi:hypothetical protein
VRAAADACGKDSGLDQKRAAKVDLTNVNNIVQRIKSFSGK